MEDEKINIDFDIFKHIMVGEAEDRGRGGGSRNSGRGKGRVKRALEVWEGEQRTLVCFPAIDSILLYVKHNFDFTVVWVCDKYITNFYFLSGNRCWYNKGVMTVWFAAHYQLAPFCIGLSLLVR